MEAQEAGRNHAIGVERRPLIERRPQGGWRLSCSQWLPGRPAEVFPFFGSARNLERITPPFLKFRIRRVRGEPLSAGSVVDYGLRLHRLPMRWRTLIEVWDPPHRFVDLQVRGPFRQWRHTHAFKQCGDRTLVSDAVDFDLYCGALARTPLLAWVDADLRAVFAYRQRATARAFRPGSGQARRSQLGGMGRNAEVRAT